MSDGKSPVVASYADVVEPVQKAVVSVYSKKTVRERVSANPLMRQFFGDMPDQERERKEEGLGSGVIISPDGYILTNNHVVEGADELKVGLADDREFIAKVIGTDPKTDVAVIKIEADNLPGADPRRQRQAAGGRRRVRGGLSPGRGTDSHHGHRFGQGTQPAGSAGGRL